MRQFFPYAEKTWFDFMLTRKLTKIAIKLDLSNHAMVSLCTPPAKVSLSVFDSKRKPKYLISG